MVGAVPVDSESTTTSRTNPINVNNATVIKHPTTLNFGGLIQPYEGSSTNGGLGGAFSRLVSSTFDPLDTLTVKGQIPSLQSFIPLAVVVIGGVLAFRFLKGRK